MPVRHGADPAVVNLLLLHQRISQCFGLRTFAGQPEEVTFARQRQCVQRSSERLGGVEPLQMNARLLVKIGATDRLIYLRQYVNLFFRQQRPQFRQAAFERR